ncbi:MAG: heme ABC exporter ATP-binding protein CcmA [Acidimicrobiaceae bacterium]|nr:heme ABC exporter ATP-binding protein CcmA [Acidimicrobiaceae bacterium]
MQSLVSFKKVIVVSGNFPILTGLDFETGPGEVVLVKGRNGAGKTSFLRAVAGLLRITKGSALVLGVDLISNPADARHRVGLLGHETFLYEDLTAKENVTFVLKATRSNISKVDAALSAVGLTGRLSDLRVSSMSAGQRKKVALAALLAREPELWLLDEPHAALDSWTREVLDTAINSSVANGATVLLVSHEPLHGSLMPTRVVELAGGKVITDTRDIKPVVAEKVPL